MRNESIGYVYLGVPLSIAPVLWETVDEMQRSLATQGDRGWAQLASASLSRCVFDFACLARERESVDRYPEAICAMVFRQSAEQLMLDSSAKEWGVSACMMPVVAGILRACGELVVARTARTD